MHSFGFFREPISRRLAYAAGAVICGGALILLLHPADGSLEQEASSLESESSEALDSDVAQILTATFPSDASVKARAAVGSIQDSQAAGMSPSDFDLKEALAALAMAYAERNEGKIGSELKNIFRGNPGVGDRILDLWLARELSPLESKGAAIYLRVSLTLARLGKEEGIHSFSERRESLVFRLIGHAFPPGGDPRRELASLLAAPGVLGKEDLSGLLPFFEGLEKERSLGGFRSIIRSILSTLGPQDRILLNPLLSSPFPEIRSLAYDTLIGLDSQEGPRLLARLPEMDLGEATAVFSAVCRKAPPESIPQLLVALTPDQVGRIDFLGPIFEYLDRSDKKEKEFEEKILFARGRGPEAAAFRARSLDAFRAQADLGRIDPTRAREVLLRVFEEDESVEVRGPALYSLALYWNVEDGPGFENLLATAAAHSALAPLVKDCRERFLERAKATIPKKKE